jgi:hypothetical protein
MKLSPPLYLLSCAFSHDERIFKALKVTILYYIFLYDLDAWNGRL